MENIHFFIQEETIHLFENTQHPSPLPHMKPASLLGSRNGNPATYKCCSIPETGSIYYRHLKTRKLCSGSHHPRISELFMIVQEMRAIIGSHKVTDRTQCATSGTSRHCATCRRLFTNHTRYTSTVPPITSSTTELKTSSQGTCGRASFE